ncbi:MAG: glycosyltransferase family 4 protein [Ruminococcus sp.]|nr:glycosyltransferase family 4 protein [Ruminococcus sp.]
MKKIVFDGQVYAQRMTGQYRYADELLKELDKIVGKDEFEIVVPEYVDIEGKFKNIKVVHYGKVKGLLWTQTSLPAYLIKHKAISVGFCNITPILRPSITAVLDIAYKVLEDEYKNLYGRLSALWHRLHYFIAAKSGKPVITISHFCKEQISEVYGVPKKRIAVIPCGWQHFLTTGEDESLFEQYPQITKGGYYFALGSLEERKNFKWIVEEARRHPEDTFVIAGGSVRNSGEKLDLTGIENLIFVGYITDEQIKSLMKHCKAFLFPSTFEGFGIPPLEALSVGAQVISSDTASMPEVLGDAVHYIDPYSHEADLGVLLRKPAAPASEALGRYSWKRSARLLRNLLKIYQEKGM